MKPVFKEKIDKLIINSPFKEPGQHWDFEKTKGKHFIKEGRRPAGYVIVSHRKKYKEVGEFIELPLVNKIRPRVKKWRDKGYPGVTSITKKLLEFWNKQRADGRDYEFFFCQKEAIETLIWLKEAHPSEKVGIEIPKDGGKFERLCTKMATGVGKTYVMAMAIAWQILNKIAYPTDARYSKYIFIVAPNLTVKARLAVLNFNTSNNYYEEKKIVPYDLLENLRQGKVHIKNWNALMWVSEEKIKKRKSVDKRGAKSDEAYIRDVLGDMSRAKNILVINDEAHHAWRNRREEKRSGIDKGETERATCWVQGLDRIQKARGILSCLDFSATPFAPSGTKGRTSYKEDLFQWIVSDFGLMDAVESGLTKTPRFVVRDDGSVDPKNLRPKLYHIYDNEGVKSNLIRKTKPKDILPGLVRNAYLLLALDWEKTLKSWEKANMPTPPVMISAVNRKETADRVNYMFNKEKIPIPELCKEETTTLIYSDLDFAKEKDKQMEELRRKVNTVGKIGKPGEQTRHVISVAMLSEGWDCQTVTHIMGLRAFSSQLLCEQIVGRGLRRTEYDNLNKDGFFNPEYVNIFGIPFSFIPQEESQEGDPRPASPKLPICVVPEKEKYKITWPIVERIDFNLKPYLKVDFKKIKPLKVSDIREVAELAPEINGYPDYTKIKTIELENLIKDKDVRIQSLIFNISNDLYDQLNHDWKNKINKDFALSQLFHIVTEFLKSDKFQIEPKAFQKDQVKRKLAIIIGMEQIIQKVCSAITQQNSEELVTYYKNPRYRSTKDMPQWNTGKQTDIFKKTHINRCVVDSAWELAHARELDRNPYVKAWAKNNHLGFQIKYVHNGVIYEYFPDFIVKLSDNSHLILEVKGVKRPKDVSKWEYMNLWIKAVNQDKEENGVWHFEVSQDETGKKVHSIIEDTLKNN